MAEPGSGSVKLTWEAVAGATGYKITKSTTSGGTFENAGTTSDNDATTCTISSLTPGTRYYFKVQGVSGATEGTQSAEVIAIANVDDNGTVFIGDKLLVSNELTDPAATVQSTGSLSINENSANMDAMDSGELDPEAYRINPVIPFEPVAGQEPVNYSMDGEMQVQATYVYGNIRSFIVDKKSESNPATINGRCAYDGTNVQVWVDTAAGAKVKLTDAQAELIGKEFDSKVYSLVTTNFGAAPNVDSDGKIAILCFDITEDNYLNPGDPYIAGFFYGGDLYKNSQLEPKNQNSNEMEIFYADTYPTMIKNPTTPDYTDPDVTKVYSTLAHEFQHMVNFNQNCLVEGDQKAMDTWLNEALSLAAEQMYNGTQTNRINFYNGSAVVGSGRSLLEWDNDLADYSLSYLFSQYLRTQVDQTLATGESVEGGNAKIFNEIIINDQEDFLAVEDVITTRVDHNLSFGQFMTNFRAAMLLKADSGPYGFNNEAGFDTISTPLYTGGTIDLKGGGAVVKSITSTSPFMPGSHGANITYLGIYN